MSINTIDVRRATLAAAWVACLQLTGCGGGGSDDAAASAPAPAPAPAATAYPSVKPAEGDYYVYQNSVTTSVPAGTAPTSSNTVRYYVNVDADGTLVRADVGSSATRFTRFYTADGAQTRVEPDVGTNVCTYAPAYRNTPLAGTLPGTSYNFSSTITCVTSGTSSSVVAGTYAAAESITLPVVGTFTAAKYSYRDTTTGTTGVTTADTTCWTDIATGRLLKCDTTSSFVPAGQTSPTNVRATAFVLSAYQRVGSAPVGDTRQGLVGKWDILDTGGGVCEGTLAAGGVYSGNCTRGNTTFTGSVDNTGHVNGTTSDGTTITGTLDSPVSGSGSVTGPGGTFGWTARRR